MTQRWPMVGLLAVALFAVNGISRLIVWLADVVDDEGQILAGLVASVVAALLAVVAGVRWAYLYRMPRVVADLLMAILVAALLAVLLGPYLGGSEPLVEGFGFAFRQFVYYGGVMAFGAALGVLLTVTAGKDWKSRGWQAQEQKLRSRPRRVP